MTQDNQRLCELREHPERAVAAEELLDLVQRELHADLTFPASEEGRLLHDYSALELPFPLPKRFRVPKGCFLDVSSLRRISEELGEGQDASTYQSWTYRWFYLEMLSVEEKLKPRLWARYDAIGEGLPLLREYETWYGGPGLPDDHSHELAKKWWARHGSKLMKKGLLFEHEDRPWLDYLVMDALPTRLGPDSPRPAPVMMSALPVYMWPEDGVILAREMRNELWRSSLFCPETSEKLRQTNYQQLRNRFAMVLRKEGWGVVSGKRAEMDARDKEVFEMFQSGKPVYRIAKHCGKKEKFVYDALYRYRKRHPEQNVS